MISFSKPRSIFAPYISRVVDIVLPPQRLLEGGLADGRAGIGADIWQHIRFLDDPCCSACGFPFDYDVGDQGLCGACAVRRPAYHRARSAFVYDETSRKLVLAFKHGGRTEALDLFATQMARAGRAYWEKADLLVPVPLHPTRLIKRRFNQAALLAKALSRKTHVPFDPDILFRHKATPSQGHQTAKGRYRNVRGAFHVPDMAQIRLKGAGVVLVDDVMTTGATLESCARTLKRAGAAYIDVITLARTVRDISGLNGDSYAES